MNCIYEEDGGLVRVGGYERLRVIPWGKNGIRIQASCESRFLDLPGALLSRDDDQEDADTEITENGARLTSGGLTVQITDTGRLIFSRTSARETLLEEVEHTPALFESREFKPDGNNWQISLRFKPREGERFYGLGQHQHGCLDQKGCVIELEHRNTEVSIPFLVSSLGYGFLWNHPGTGRVELGQNGTCWTADTARQIDFVVFEGKNPEQVLRRYTEATGFPPPFPEWASGFWQSKCLYESQDMLLDVAREHKKRDLPLSVIVVDFHHWPVMGDLKFDLNEWPAPRGMVKELEDMGVKVMVSIWPTVSVLSENHDHMKKYGMLVRNERGRPAHIGGGEKDHRGDVSFYDATNPEARKFLWKKVRDNYCRFGIKIFWLDACEPELKPPHHENIRYHLGPGSEVGGLYPLLHQKGFFEGLRSEGETEVLTLCRSAWAGSQRYGAAVWSGDIPSTFDALKRQVPAGLNAAMSGIPWWTTDIGGFINGDTEDPEFRELIVRWFQYGVFCPLFRIHGCRKPRQGETYGPNEVWSFGDEAYEIIREQLFLRERLRPYIMTQMKAAEEHAVPPMRPVFFDFPEDPRAWDEEDIFMFGPDILAAPVCEKGITERIVYLPSGTDWTDVWTGSTHTGGTELTAPAPLCRIPVYVRKENKELAGLIRGE